MLVRTQPTPLRLVTRAALGALIILALQVSSTNAEGGSFPQNGASKSYPVVSPETYSQVLDILFPRDDPDPSKTLFEIVLRFRPSFRSTTQIVVRRRVDKTEVTEYTSLDGNIYSRLNEALARGSKEDAVELAKSLRVKRREISVRHTQVKRWYVAFFDSSKRISTGEFRMTIPKTRFIT